MLKSIYTPASGALTQERVLEIIANNLANTNTTGFKRERVSFEVLDPEPNKHYANPLPPANFKFNMEDIMPLVGNEVEYVGISDVARDLTQGPAMQTNNMTDTMIEGRGYYEVQTPEGQRYTRDGSLSRNTAGILVNRTGHPIQGERGAIALKSGAFEINELGEVYQSSQMIDKIKIVIPKNESAFERIGNNYYVHHGTDAELSKAGSAKIKQGFLEGSNVNAIQSMTNMIVAHRSYEAYTKAISNYDKIMDKSSNSIGEVRV